MFNILITYRQGGSSSYCFGFFHRIIIIYKPFRQKIAQVMFKLI